MIRNRSVTRLVRLVCISVSLALAVTCRPAQAQTDYDWSNSSGGDFNTPANWNPGGGPPGAADTAFF